MPALPIPHASRPPTLPPGQSSTVGIHPTIKVGILTAGGLAPCLSSAVGYLIEKYEKIDPTIEIICYRSGYRGLLLGRDSPPAPRL